MVQADILFQISISIAIVVATALALLARVTRQPLILAYLNGPPGSSLSRRWRASAPRHRRRREVAHCRRLVRLYMRPSVPSDPI